MELTNPYVAPDTSPQSVVESFSVHSKIRSEMLKTYRYPCQEEFDHVLFALETQFRNCSAELSPDWNSRSNFDRVLLRLDRQSSPGWPLCLESPTISKWLFKDGPLPDPVRSNLLWTMVNDVFSGSYEHRFKVFIKNEPHKASKAAQKRWRLIMMCSLPVQVAWHMAIEHLEKKFLRTYTNPLMHSLVYFGGGWRYFRYYYKQHNLNWCADKSGWDWNSPGWVYEACLELRLRLTVGATQEWRRVIHWLYEDAYWASTVVLPDGRVLRQLEPGLMKSGLVSTISDNGIAQIALHILASKRLGVPLKRVVATGDDTFQQEPDDEWLYVLELQKAGCLVKEYGRGEDFMGFEITPSGFRPKYFEKHVAAFRLQRDMYLAESLEGYLRIYAHSPKEFEFWKRVAAHLHIPTPSHQYFKYFADNPDALEDYRVARPSFADRVMEEGVVD